MGSREKLFREALADASQTPLQKVQKWFEVSAMEGYVVCALYLTLFPQIYVKFVDQYQGHDALLPKIMTIESVEHKPTPDNPHHCTTVFSMTVPGELCNMSGSLHGGAVALIFDIATSTAITASSKDGFWDTGHVSRTLNCTYLRPAPEGAKISIESEVVHLGKRMGLTRGVIKTEDGKVCYTCEHGKASVGNSSL